MSLLENTTNNESIQMVFLFAKKNINLLILLFPGSKEEIDDPLEEDRDDDEEEEIQDNCKTKLIFINSTLIYLWIKNNH